MKKRNSRNRRSGDSMRPEYDFSKGVRGKHAARYASGTNVVVLEPDVAREFPTSDDVNETLRTVATLLHRRKSRSKSKTA
ncbi:MAG: hypothetical protein ACXVZR_05975 [Terriglobales bacterium]